MKIYLAGKVRNGQRRENNWRGSLVDDRWYTGNFGKNYDSGNGIDFDGSCGVDTPPDTWPILPKAVLGVFDYVGPYLVSCDHGCFHTGDHATYCDWASDPDADKGHSPVKAARRRIINLCSRAIMSADIVFCWIDCLDCYGTLAELVLSVSFNRRVVIATSDPSKIDEMWFAIDMATMVSAENKFIVADTPEEALRKLIQSDTPTLDLSPIEEMFWGEWRKSEDNTLVPQYEVPDTRYRVDFAAPQFKIAVELDGYEYHNDKETFTKDRKRQRDLERRGWRFIRFSGSEIYHNVIKCVQETRALITTYKVQANKTS